VLPDGISALELFDGAGMLAQVAAKKIIVIELAEKKKESCTIGV